MSFPKKYDEGTVAQIKAWADNGLSSGLIAQRLKTSRSAVASLCTRLGIKLKGERTLISPGGVKRGRKPKPPAGPLPDDTILAPCLWPDGCQELRQAWSKPYCLAHNTRAFVPVKPLKG